MPKIIDCNPGDMGSVPAETYMIRGGIVKWTCPKSLQYNKKSPSVLQ